MSMVLFNAGCDSTATTPKPLPQRVDVPAPVESPQVVTPPTQEAKSKPFPTTAADWTGGDKLTAAEQRVEVGPLTFAVPQGWLARPASSTMRLAEMIIVQDAKAGTQYNPATDALAAFFRLGGSVEDNIKRWEASVTGTDGKPVTATITVKEIAGLKVHDVRMNGTYLDGMPGGQRTSRDAWGFRAAIIETGLPLTFIRLTGPQSLLDANAAQWDALLASMQAKAKAPQGTMPPGHPPTPPGG